MLNSNNKQMSLELQLLVSTKLTRKIALRLMMTKTKKNLKKALNLLAKKIL